MAYIGNNLHPYTKFGGLFVIFFTVNYCVSGQSQDGTPQSKWFGDIGNPLPVNTLNVFPESTDFFDSFVFRSIPVKITNGAYLSPALSKWTDEYLIGLSKTIPKEETVVVERTKTENRSLPIDPIHFHDFLTIYKTSEVYMVNSIPDVLLSDLVMPDPLQCDILNDSYRHHFMWFSNGGTKSTVHVDSVDSMICVYRGSKNIVLVDPFIFGDQVDMDHPESAYSGVDVDNVNYTAYPGLLNVQYHHVTLDKGDCLYIPYHWIHQVRSTGPNIAVSIWMDHHRINELDFNQCDTKPSKDMTLDTVTFDPYSEWENKIEYLIETIFMFSQRTWDSSVDKLFQMFMGDKAAKDAETEERLRTPVRKIFEIFDTDLDGKIQPKEVMVLSENEWDIVEVLTFKLLSDIQELEGKNKIKETRGVLIRHDEF